MSNPPNGRNPIGQEIILEELAKQPDAPARRLARQLYHRHPEVWPRMEACRSHIRELVGQNGNKNRKQIKLTTFYREGRKPGDNPIILPSEAKPISPFVIHDSRIGVLADVHIPYHDKVALDAAIAYLKTRKIKGLLLLGDIVDFYQLSRFSKDPRKKKLKDELVVLNEFLEYLRMTFPRIPIYYKTGNHEMRLERYLVDKAPELLDISDRWKLEQLLPFDDLGIDTISWCEPIYYGKLTLLHGHEFPTPVIGPVNAARGLFMRACASALVAHHHQSSEHIAKAVRQELIGCWSIGCLCGLQPEYAVMNKWGHGVACIEKDGDGLFEVHNKKIFNGLVV